MVKKGKRAGRIAASGKRAAHPGIIFFTLAIVVLFLDQMTKFFVSIWMRAGETAGNKVLGITFVTNTGTAFGLFPGGNFLLIWVSIIVIGAVLYYRERAYPSVFATAMLSLVLAGAAGNLLDRVLQGFVTDFIKISIWPAFNVADTAITAGVIGLIAHFWNK